MADGTSETSIFTYKNTDTGESIKLVRTEYEKYYIYMKIRNEFNLLDIDQNKYALIHPEDNYLTFNLQYYVIKYNECG